MAHLDFKNNMSHVFVSCLIAVFFFPFIAGRTVGVIGGAVG